MGLMQELIATHDHGRLQGDGVHEKRTVTASDEQTYVIKSYGPNEQGEPSKAPSNEAVSYALARHLGIPVPPYAVVDVGPDFAWLEPIGLFTPGRYFGSRFLGRAPLAKGSDIWATQDIDSVYMLLAFDVLLANGDRKPSDMLRGATTNGVLDGLTAIDFGNAFTGSHWCPRHLGRNHNAPLHPIDEWLFWGTPDHNIGQRVAHQAASTTGVFEDAISEATPYWDLDDEDRAAIRDFLVGRAGNLGCSQVHVYAPVGNHRAQGPASDAHGASTKTAIAARPKGSKQCGAEDPSLRAMRNNRLQAMDAEGRCDRYQGIPRRNGCTGSLDGRSDTIQTGNSSFRDTRT
jgi:hypothetical protein